MPFMQPEITPRGRHWVIDTADGVWAVPFSLVDPPPFLANDESMSANDLGEHWINALATFVGARTHRWNSLEIRVGYCARMSAPGYLDCTEWTFHTTLREARQHLKESA